MTDERQGREIESLNGWWHTWLDEAAAWEREELLWPGVSTDSLPMRAPSAGWDGMEWGMESTRVPGTLAQARPGYHGVAWQWRPIVIPEEWQGRLVRLRFGGARQRLEAYLDNRPVGYDLDGLTPFAVDLTPHVRFGGQHELALRVTNPGGWRAAEEGGAIGWGEAALPGSRDIGGLWGGVALEAAPRLHVDDLHVLAGEAIGEVSARVTLHNAGPAAVAHVRASIRDAAGRPAAHRPAETTVVVPEGGDAVQTLPLAIADPKDWAPGRPHLYRVIVEARCEHGMDRAEAPVGLWRVAEGDGRILIGDVPLGPHVGETPDPLEGEGPSFPAAEREVARARAVGLDILVSRGWPATPELLDAADRLGLPVVQTLVGVEDPARVPPDARGLYTALAQDRLRRLIRRDRNHPCVVAWRLPMARDAAAYEPYARLIHDEDPTRPVIAAHGL